MDDANQYQFAPNATGWVDVLGLKKCDDPCAGKDPAKEASEWQGKGKYSGKDKWENVALYPGDRLYTLIPNGGQPPGFAVLINTVAKFQDNPRGYHRKLQIFSPKWKRRINFQEYIVVEPICVASGKTKENKQFGKGGEKQFFVPRVERSKLQKAGQILGSYRN